jgi:hypothetical protein
VSEQPEALSLADYLDLPHVGQHRSAAELRRLHAANAELLEALREIASDTHDDSAERVARAAIARAEGVKP